MFNPHNWVPYPIPQAPNVGPKEKWALSLKEGATGNTNPSKFFMWRKVGFTRGEEKWEMLYWDPSAESEDGEDSGNWVTLEAPKTDNTVLTFKDDTLQWKEAIGRGSKKGDMLYWDPSAGEDGAWVVLPAPSGGKLKGLVFKGNIPFWVEALTFTICENGLPKDYNFIAQPSE